MYHLVHPETMPVCVGAGAVTVEHVEDADVLTLVETVLEDVFSELEDLLEEVVDEVVEVFKEPVELVLADDFTELEDLLEEVIILVDDAAEVFDELLEE